MGAFSRILRSGEGKKIKALEAIVPDINAIEPETTALSDDALRAKTGEFRQRFERGEDIDDLLVEAFAVVREAAVRVIGQRHYDVQIMGGVALHLGWVAEMRTSPAVAAEVGRMLSRFVNDAPKSPGSSSVGFVVMPLSGAECQSDGDA